eukprot:1120578-Lingulodinium_polyedra.AAC.1
MGQPPRRSESQAKLLDRVVHVVVSHEGLAPQLGRPTPRPAQAGQPSVQLLAGAGASTQGPVWTCRRTQRPDVALDTCACRPADGPASKDV